MNKNVMFTDMVGYSKLTGDDQNLALELLKEHDKIIEPIIEKYKGSIVKRIGDAIVAIFDDPTNMIQSGVEIQQGLKNRNNRNTKSRHIILRIGLHYGEITLKNDEVYGLGYELASSIEPICEYGGIAVSEDLYNHAHEDYELILRGKKNHFFIRPIANFSFKSISNKLTIFKLYLNLLDWYEESQNQVHQYLKKQNIKSDKYDLNLLNNRSRSNVDHYQAAVKFQNKHNLSYAVYHYKMHLDYDTNHKQNIDDIKLSILYIFSKLGLNRLVDKMCADLSDSSQSKPYFYFIKGIVAFNSNSFFESQEYFEQSLTDTNSDFFIEACYYSLIIFMKNQDYNKGLNLISYHEDFFKSDSINKIRFKLIRLIFEFHKKNSNELETLIKTEHATFSNQQIDSHTLFIYSFLMQFYQNNSNTKAALDIQNKAYLVINELANHISGLQLKELFIEKPILHQILNDEIEMVFTSNSSSENFIEPDTSSKMKMDVFKFCVECGFKNDKNFSFCPSCGGELTK